LLAEHPQRSFLITTRQFPVYSLVDLQLSESFCMNFNMGCGFNKIPGFVNVDKFSECLPDLQFDLEQIPWPIESEQADTVIFNHCLEHIGQQTDVFFGIFRELYRICKRNSIVIVNVPHPRHDDYLNDPTHVRMITPGVLSLFSKKNCIFWKENRYANSPLAIYLDVDFEITKTTVMLTDYYLKKMNKGELTHSQINQLINERNNVAQEYKFELRVVK
jgi:hypothetical protein